MCLRRTSASHVRSEGRFAEELTSAQQNLKNKERRVAATAVEDKLQDGMRETLVNLGLAGISVWILTEVKKETAINISYS